MRKSIVILITFAVLVFAGPALHAQEAVQATPTESVEAGRVFLHFVDALKKGNVRVLKSLLSEEMYSEYRVLLEENKEYPRFLERYYEGTDVQLENIFREGNELYGVMRVTFPGGDTSVLVISVGKKDGKAPWKIGRVLNEKWEKKSSTPK
jgi:hypothetical protein